MHIGTSRERVTKNPIIKTTMHKEITVATSNFFDLDDNFFMVFISCYLYLFFTLMGAKKVEIKIKETKHKKCTSEVM
jgi:hypothetical protein